MLLKTICLSILSFLFVTVHSAPLPNDAIYLGHGCFYYFDMVKGADVLYWYHSRHDYADPYQMITTVRHYYQNEERLDGEKPQSKAPIQSKKQIMKSSFVLIPDIKIWEPEQEAAPLAAKNVKSDVEKITVEQQASLNGYKKALSHFIIREYAAFEKMSERSMERCTIFQHEENIYSSYKQEYTLSGKLITHMRKYALNPQVFTICNGHILQQTLHEEIIEILGINCEIENIFAKYGEKAQFSNLILEGAALAHECNQLGDVVNGFRIADYCGWLNEAERPRLAATLKQAAGIVVGFGEGIYNIIDFAVQFVARPIESGENLLKACNEAGSYLMHSSIELSAYAYHIGYSGTAEDMIPFHNQRDVNDICKPHEHTPSFKKDLAVINKEIDHFTTLPEEEKTRKIVALATEIVCSGKALGQLCKAGSIVSSRVLKPRVATIANKLQNFQQKAIAKTCEKIANASAKVKNLLHDSNLIPGSSVAKSVAEELSALKKYAFEIRPGPNWCKNMQNKFLKINIEHIFAIDPKSVNKIKGFHHDFLGYLEQTGVVSLKNVKMGKFGEYMADVIWNGTKTIEKTFFPKHWTRQQVLEKIVEAYDNYIKSVKKSGITPKLQADGKYIIQSRTNSGMLIEMIIDQKCNLSTAYPII